MEHRIALTKAEALELSGKLNTLGVGYVRDEYTGTKRYRTDETGVREKDYKTPVTGTILNQIIS